MSRAQKITFAQMMRSSGVRGLLVYCADYKCSHYRAMARWCSAVRSRTFRLLGVRQARCWRAAGFRMGQAGRAHQGVFDRAKGHAKNKKAPD